jgi:hypothetical protein
MILELGSSTEWIRVTAEYSNAVLVAVLPHISEFAKQIDLPLPQQIKTEQVAGCGIVPYRTRGSGGHDTPVGVVLTNGWSFRFIDGWVNSFSSPDCYFGLQDPQQIPRFFGTVRMKPAEAAGLARETIRRLGIPLEIFFAEQEARIHPLETVGANVVPRYRIEWVNPVGGQTVEVEVNADARRVESMSLRSSYIKKPPPRITVIPPPGRSFVPYRSPTINPVYAQKLIALVLRAVDAYGKVLSLPVPRPLTTNHVARFELHDNGGWPASELELTNGWRFVYRNSMVNGHYAPNNLFGSDNRPRVMKDLAGQWRMSEAQAIELVKQTLAKFHHPTNLVHVDFAPKVSKPVLPGIPRYSIHWWKENEDKSDLVCKVEAEVDADKGELTSLYYDHVAYWNKPPPIDVPLSLPQPRANAAQTGAAHSFPAASNRPFKPFTTNNAVSRK